MRPVTIGIRREDKPFERRVALVPADLEAMRRVEGFEFIVESSSQRAFGDDEYRRAGASLAPLARSAARVIVGLKEIPESVFEPGRVYLFWAHVIKGQPHNMAMLRRMLAVGATLIDYERILDAATGRALDFSSRWAGRAGMAETLRLYGRRLAGQGFPDNPFAHLKPTYE